MESLLTTRARRELAQAIERIPNLLSATVVEKFTHAPRHVVHTQHEVADRIASVLPDALIARGCVLVDLPVVEPDPLGGFSLRVPLSRQPWADCEVRLDALGCDVILSGLPQRLAVIDGAHVAAAVMAVVLAERQQSSRSSSRGH